MISVAKKRWEEIPEISSKDVSSKLFSTINMIYESLEEHKRYAYVLEIDFGDFVIREGVINKKDIKGFDLKSFTDDINYSEDPLALVIQNQIEVYTINTCDNRRRIIKRYDSNSDNSIVEKEYIVPLNVIKKGDFYGVFGTLDYLSKIELRAEHGMNWSAVAGLSSFILDFPFFYSTVNIRDNYKEYFEQYDNKNYYPYYYSGKEQIDFIRCFLSNYKTRVVYFPKHILTTENENLWENLHYYLLIKGWEQYSPLRSAAFHDKVYTDILKIKTLKNNAEFIIKLFDHLRNVFLGNGKILRPLKPNENHFLNDALRVFKENCRNYFNENKKHILPLCYIYDDSSSVDVGILSLTNLPILKNYKYTSLEDVINDLYDLNKYLRNKPGYLLDLDNRVSAFGGIDRFNKYEKEFKTKGTSEFKKLIASLFHIGDNKKILPSSGQFQNAIVVTLK